jgi:hypothetical protein
LPAAAAEKSVGNDKEGVGARARKGGEGCINLADTRGVEDFDR